MTKKILLFLILLSTLPFTLLQAQTVYTQIANGKTWSYTVSGGKATITGATNIDGTQASGELNIPSQIGAYTVTSIGNEAFQYNNSITKLTANSVTTISDSAFYTCRGLTSLQLPKVTTIGGNTFYQCTSLTGKLELPKVTTIGNNAFSGCTGLTNLQLPSVTSIGVLSFYRCTGLTGKLELLNVTTIGNSAFYNCTGLTGKLELPNVTTINNHVFYNCRGLTSLQLPKATTIGDNTFYGCTGLTSLQLPNVTTIAGYAFYGCTGLIGKLELPKVTNIGEWAFAYCTGTGLELLSVTAIDKCAFYQCTGFTGSLSLPKLKNIGNWAFYQCSSLTGNLELPNVTDIGYQAFYQCRGFNGSLSIPKAVTIGNDAFFACNGFTGTLNLAEATTIGDAAFASCTGFNGSLFLPKVQTIGNGAFQSCNGFTGILNLPKSLTSIGNNTFAFCQKLQAIKFENETTLNNITGTGKQVFGWCNNLQYIDMAGVTFSTSISGLKISRSSSLFERLNPYTMVYLTASIPAAQSGEENFVIGGTCNKFVIYEKHNDYQSGSVGCDYPIQYDFTATTAEYRDRSFTGTTCKTICLPYAITLPTGMRAYRLVAKTGGGTSFRFVAIGDGDGTLKLDANTPYLIRITDVSSPVFDTENNVQVLATPTKMEVALADGQTFFGGTTINIDNAMATASSTEGYYNLIRDEWRPIRSDKTTGYVHSFRAYIRTTGSAPAKSFAIVLDDQTTDIDNATELSDDELKSGKYVFYTLDGRRIGTDYNQLRSGEMYVIKGQKFYKF